MQRKPLLLIALLLLMGALVVACGPSAESIQSTADAQVAAAQADAEAAREAAAAAEAAAAEAESMAAADIDAANMAAEDAAAKAEEAAQVAADAAAAAESAESGQAEAQATADAAQAAADAAAAAQADAEAAAADAESAAMEAQEAAEMAMADCNVDLTGQELIVHQQAGREGPLASILGDGFAFATEDALRIINERGGVCGAELVVEYCESNYAVEKEIECYEGFRAADPAPVVLLTYGSGATIALKDRVIEDKIVNIAAGLNAEAIYSPRGGYTVGAAPIYSDQFAGFSKWLSDNWADVKPETAGDDIVIGVIGWPGAFGAGATTPEALAVVESYGITVLPLEEQPLDPAADVSGQLQNLLLQGANVIWNQNLSFSTSQVMGTMRALGQWDNVIVSGVNWTMNVDVVNFLGETPEAANGYYGVFPYLGWDDVDSPGVQLAMEAFADGGYPETDRSSTYLLTFATFFAIHDIMEKAINENGIDGLSGETFLAAMQDMAIVDAAGILEIDMRGDNRAPNRAQIRQMQWNGEKIVFGVVQDYFNLPDTRPPAP